MSSAPLISVLIPTYNREKILPISINSALSQTYKNFEVVVIDDCSTDDTEAVVDRYDPNVVRYVKHSSNFGGAVARNTGIDAAKGEYIAFLDSDDAWVPNKLELQYAHIQGCNFPEKVVSYTQVFHSLEGISSSTFNTFNPMYYKPKRGKDKSKTVGDYILCDKGKMLTSTLMLNHQLAKKVRFRDKLRKHQDWDFCLRLEAEGACFSFLGKPLTVWNGDSTFEHVGRNPNYELSELWLEECRQYLSPKAIARFNMTRILPALMEKRIRKAYAQRLLAESWLLGQVPLKQFLKFSKRVWI